MEECYKIYIPPRLFFTFFKLYKWYQIVQHTTFVMHIKHSHFNTIIIDRWHQELEVYLSSTLQSNAPYSYLLNIIY